MIFGIVGTVITYICFSGFTLLANQSGFMKQYSSVTGEWSDLILTDAECLIMCSLLCSSDVIAAISLISYVKQPRLFSIVFGEGIMNDAVSIILFNTVKKYTLANNEITYMTPFDILQNFFNLGYSSISVGVIIGLASAYITKNFRDLCRNSVHESMLIFVFGYITYIIGEVMEASGIIALLTAGMVMAHYTWFNLSPQGK